MVRVSAQTEGSYALPVFTIKQDFLFNSVKRRSVTTCKWTHTFMTVYEIDYPIRIHGQHLGKQTALGHNGLEMVFL